MSESAQSRHSRLPALAMAVALIALAVAITTCVWSSVDGGEAGLSDALIGAIPTTILAIASVAISIAALARDVRPKWVAVTAFVISGVLALYFGLPLLGALLFELESMTSNPGEASLLFGAFFPGIPGIVRGRMSHKIPSSHGAEWRDQGASTLLAGRRCALLSGHV